jgi:hypothetical protein
MTKWKISRKGDVTDRKTGSRLGAVRRSPLGDRWEALLVGGGIVTLHPYREHAAEYLWETWDLRTRMQQLERTEWLWGTGGL